MTKEFRYPFTFIQGKVNKAIKPEDGKRRNALYPDRKYFGGIT